MGTGRAVIGTFDVVPVSRPFDVSVNPAGTFVELNVTIAFDGKTLADNWFELGTFEYTLSVGALNLMIGE